MENISEFFQWAVNSKPVIIIAILFATFIASRLMKAAIKKYAQLSKVDISQYSFMLHLLSAVIYLIGISGIVYMIPPLRALSISILAGAGVLAIVIGFASQQAFSNLISGLFIMMSRPYTVGHIIKIDGDIIGKVEDITLRHTVIRTFENNMVVVPNSKMNNETIENYNLNDRKMCKWINFGISYDSDINKAIKIMKSEAEKHPNCIDTRTAEQVKNNEPVVNVRVISLGDSSVNLRAWVWAKDPGAGFVMSCDLNKSIKERFDREGIEIPFPYRTIVMKKESSKKKR